MSQKLYAINVHLFAFHLYKDTSLSNDIGETNKHWLWKKCDEIIRKALNQNLNIEDWLDLEKEPESQYIELVKADKNTVIVPIVREAECSQLIDKSHIQNSTLPTVPKVQSLKWHNLLKITGYAYPLRLSEDSYGLWLNLRRPEKENNQPTADVDISLLSQLNTDNCMILQGNDNFLGQTIIITAYLPPSYNPNEPKELKKLADECLQAFFPRHYKIPPFSRTSTLFGSPIFEYGLFSQLSNYCHVLIWFFTSQETNNKFGQYQEELFNLFFFRAKAVNAFQVSRRYYHDTKVYHRYIENEINNLDKFSNEASARQLKPSELEKFKAEELEQLKQKLKDLPKESLKYTELLRELDNCQNTISIHTRNYTERLQQIRSINPDEDISFLEEFSQKNCLFFQEQIKFDLGYFNHGSSLLDKAIASIRGRVAIDQAQRDRITEDKQQERDRNLQIFILAGGLTLT
jgi:hypothetical protein